MSDDSGGYPGAPPGWYADPAGGPGSDGGTATPGPRPRCCPPFRPHHRRRRRRRRRRPPTLRASRRLPSAHGAPQPWVPATRDARDLVGDELRISPLARFAIAFPAVLTPGQRDLLGGQRVAVAELRPPVPRGPGRRPEPSDRPGPDRALKPSAGSPTPAPVRHRRRRRGVRLAVPGGHRGPGAGAPGQALTRMGRRLLVHPRRQLLDALSGHPGLPGARRSQPGARVALLAALSSGWASASALTIIALMISTPVGVVFALLTGLSALGVLATAPQVVLSIAAAHRAAVNP